MWVALCGRLLGVGLGCSRWNLWGRTLCHGGTGSSDGLDNRGVDSLGTRRHGFTGTLRRGSLAATRLAAISGKGDLATALGVFVVLEINIDLFLLASIALPESGCSVVRDGAVAADLKTWLRHLLDITLKNFGGRCPPAASTLRVR